MKARVSKLWKRSSGPSLYDSVSSGPNLVTLSSSVLSGTCSFWSIGFNIGLHLLEPVGDVSEKAQFAFLDYGRDWHCSYSRPDYHVTDVVCVGNLEDPPEAPHVEVVQLLILGINDHLWFTRW